MNFVRKRNGQKVISRIWRGRHCGSTGATFWVALTPYCMACNGVPPLLLNQVLAGAQSGRQQILAQALESLPPTMGDQNGAPACWFQPGPASAMEGICGANYNMEVFPFLFFTYSAF